MILAANRPLEATGRPLRALQISLNSPVVTLESLPPGPASAAVAVHERGATLCVRSLRTGQVVFFTTTEELAGHRRVALDAALSFAESMGFLFDDDLVAARGDTGPEEAARLWRELCGDRFVPAEAATPPASPPELAPEPRASAAEILLVESVEADAPDSEPPPPPPPDPARVLSKFRFAAGASL